MIVSDTRLERVVEGPELVLRQDEALLAGMDDWNQQQHGASGLVERVRASELDEAGAESRILEFLRAHCEPGQSPLAGNSVHHDRRFLRRYMPTLDAFLHYRIVDVSTLKVLAQAWYPELAATAPPKGEEHRALADIRESLEELRWYRSKLFRA